MRGSAFHFAELASQAPGHAPDVLLVSDYLNLADWRSVAPPGWRDAPCVLYFHENQVTYPLGSSAPEDFHYGWINLGSALASERVLFNSRYHREAFLDGVARGLGRMAEPVPRDLPERIRSRSSVFPVGIDFADHRRVLAGPPRRTGGPPAIAWNHRWEYDKNPGLLLEALESLKGSHVPFRLIICGQRFREEPGEFRALSARFHDELIHMGTIEHRMEYLEMLAGADAILSTARQEFFGVSVVEAMYLGCLPLLPRALSYPELLPEPLHAHFLYDGPTALPGFLKRFLRSPPVHLRKAVHEAAARFDWRTLAGKLDTILEETARQGRR
jgi:glycosyltransferase involved in cell wall biosynthesis